MHHLIPVILGGAPIAQDGFNRPDAGTLGSPWLTLGVCTWTILNSKAVQTNTVTTTAVVAYVDALVPDFVLSAKVTFQINEGLAFRIQDVTNYLTVRLSSLGLGLFRIIGGTATQLGTYAITPVVGTVYTIKIRTSGSNIAVYLDGLQVIVVSETQYQTLTKVGIREATPNLGNGAYDDFIVEAL